MNPEDLGLTSEQIKYITENNLGTLQIGRVMAEHKERYIVRTAQGESEAEITGNLRFTAKSREDFPVVGDWVALSVCDIDFAIIHRILPRFSMIKRKAAGQTGDVQVIAANIDYALIVQAADRDFNINRLERYLILCNESGISPVIVLSKTDLISRELVSEMSKNIRARIQNIPLLALSNETQEGFEALRSILEKGKTYCLLGSSGVGKSTLINTLSGKQLMQTGSISQNTNKGRHITSHRELIVLENGGILIDNPGMREVGIADSQDGLEVTFDKISQLSLLCRFKDCTHTRETGCAVIEAVERGDLDKASLENYLKLEREKAYFEATVEERRKKDRDFGKILKNYQKDLKKNQY